MTNGSLKTFSHIVDSRFVWTYAQIVPTLRIRARRVLYVRHHASYVRQQHVSHAQNLLASEATYT